MKFTIYPDGTQKAPGDYDSAFTRRVPVVDILLEPSFDLPLYSLGAFAIGIPPGDDLPGRGFTVALYETRKYHKDRLIDDRLDATSVKGVVRADKAKDAIELSKGHEYTLILFGDQLPSTPSPYSPAQYPGAPGFGQPAQLPGTPGTVPQAGYGRPGGAPPLPGQPGYPSPTPYPFATPYPEPTDD